MSADEDTELRDLVAQTLEANGVLGKIRAQLRASVFLALEEQEKVKNKTPLLNVELQKFLTTSEGRDVVSLVREFLQFFNLEYSLAVFDPEICCALDKLESNRTALGRSLNIVERAESSKQPLLSSVVRQCRAGDARRGSQPLAEVLSPELVASARFKFEQYDQDGNKLIDKDELRQLFCDLFPDFHRNMIDRYVNDEFRAADVDFSSGIDFEEFLAIYKRIFVLCKSTVAGEVGDLTRRDSLPLSARSHKSNNNDNSSADEKSEIIAPRPASKSTALAGNKATAERTTAKKDVSEADSELDDFFEKKDKPWERKEDTRPAASAASKPAAANSSMSSLAGLPSLTAKVTATSDDAKGDSRAGKSKLIDLEYDDDEDKYDDDFQASNISPVGQTPRSARSDKNLRSLENDEIDEEIEEELSIGDDLLKSEASANDDLTTDRTVSPAEHSTAADYVEDVLHP